MTALEYAIWGMLGGFAVVGTDVLSDIAVHGSWPRELTVKTVAFGLVALLLRAGLGVIVCLAMGLSGQITGPGGALAIGAAAPLVIRRAAGHANEALNGPTGAVAAEGKSDGDSRLDVPPGERS